MRYVYLKNGDAVDQVRRAFAGHVDRSGPDAFISDFLRAHATDELLVLSRWRTRERVASGRVTAESYSAAGPRALRGLARAWSALRIGFRMLAWRPDRIVCGCSGELLWAAVVVAKLRRVPIVNSRHEWLQERRGLGALMSVFNRASVRACAGIACHGPFLADQMRTLGVPSTLIREFEVDLSGFAAPSVAGELPERFREFVRGAAAIVMYVGRIQRDKGVIDLLTAFCALPADAAAGVRLVYVGDGVEMQMLRDAVEQRHVSQSVLILGKIPHGQLAALIAAATVVAAPTRPELPEGRCMVVLESMVLGVPVIAPDFAAFPYVIRHGINGLLFAPGDAADLSRNLARVTQPDGVLAKLRSGARDTAKELLAAHAGFASAVDSAFDAAGRS
ncbi:MAG: glycosyltransferase [Gammaproteobacteria bacterium]